MSTFDPNLEPPGDWQMPYNQPTPQGSNEATATASVWVWVCAGMGLLMSGCCLLSMLGTIMLSDQFIEQMRSNSPELQNMDMKMLLHVVLVVMAIVTVCMIFLPALVLSVLGFSVRKGRRSAIVTSSCIAWLYIALAGVGSFFTLIGIVAQGQLSGILSLMIQGAWLWISIITVKKLNLALRAQSYSPQYGSWQ